MDKHTLAQQLRQRQYAKGLLSRSVIDAVTDDDIIDSYITCSCCGQKQVTPLQLEAVIGQAHDSYHFMTMCDELSRATSKGHIQLPAQTIPDRASWRRKRKR